MAALPGSGSPVGFFLLKGSFFSFLSAVALCMLRTGDWIEEKFLMNLI